MAYFPFLLPQLDRPELEAGVDSPAAEERCLGRFGPTIWTILQKKVPLAYGLPLLTTWPGEERATEWRSVTAAGQRALTTGQTGQATILIEHPEGIDLADHLAPQGATVFIARPALFLSLWREAHRTPDAAVDSRVGDSPSTRLHGLLNDLVSRPGLSDWHLIPAADHYASRLRLSGQLLHEGSLSKAEGRTRIQAICASAGMESSPPRAAIEGRLSLETAKGPYLIRLSVVPSQFGPALTARFLPQGPAASPTVERLGMTRETLNAVQARFARQEGLWLVAGPTGSGKSTTLHALLKQAVAQKEKILSIEDPVERTLEGVQQMSLHCPPGLTYAIALKASLRQAPNTILLGEIRDAETAAIAFQAARAGHRVLSTLHARDTHGLLSRLADLGQPAESVHRVAPTLLHQRLLPRLCAVCRTHSPLPQAWGDLFRARALTPPDTVWQASGCAECAGGWSGQRAVFALCSGLQTEPTGLTFLREALAPLGTGEISLASLLPFIPSEERQPLHLPSLPHDQAR